MARRGFRLRIPGMRGLKLNNQQSWLLGAGLVGLLGLGFLAWSGRKTGIGFLDTAAGRFEDVYEQYVGPLGPGAPPAPVSTAPVVPAAPAAGGGRGISFDDMVFSGAYATDSPTPYVDWWNNDIADDDRIIVA